MEVPVGFSFPLREIGFVCRQKDADSVFNRYVFDDETGIRIDKECKKIPSDHYDQMGFLDFKKVSCHCITYVTFDSNFAALRSSSAKFIAPAIILLSY